MALIRNISGTSDDKCPTCASWLDHWKNRTNENRTGCSIIGCPGGAEVGAHVKRTDMYDNKIYIVPMCHAHNQDHDHTFNIGFTYLVATDDRSRCKKQI